MSRDSTLGLTFTGVNYYDGQGFMVKKELGVSSALQLNGASVCVQTGTTTELNLADYFKRNNMNTTRSCSRSSRKSTPPTMPAAATPTRRTPPASIRSA